MRSHAHRADDCTMTRPTLTATILIALAAAGCGNSDGTARNKAGAEAARTQQVLRLESTDAGSPEALHLAQRIKARSGGALSVEIRQSYPASLPANEARLARAVRAGKADFGILPARAWPAAGVPALAALQAPFVLSDYDVAGRAIAGPAGATLKDALKRAGVVPLALLPTQLRRVLAVKPLAGADDFRDLRIRISDNATAAAGLRALGARPIEGVATDGVIDGLERHRLDGVEISPGFAVSNGYWRNARNITGYALFDRVDTIVASPAAWKRLSGSQRAAVTAAVADTIRFTATLPERDAASLETLCADGVRVTAPTAAQLEALAQATEPTRAALRAAPATARVMRELEATEGAGPRRLPPPEACAAAGALKGQETDGAATIPDGVYVTRTTRKDYQSRGEYSGDWSAPVYKWTTRLRNGKWVMLVTPKFPGQVGDIDGAGTYETHGDQVTFRYTYPEDARGGPPETFRWSYYQGQLTLEVVDVADLGSQIIHTAHPWRKVR
jgi:TRAP-type C4-dicarboxylate transport system substrate-binding protein